MKTIILLLGVIVLLDGCKKTEDVTTQTNQTPITGNNPVYEAGPGFTGAAPIPQDEHERIPLYEDLSRIPNARIATTVGTTQADLSADMPPPANQGRENSCTAFAVGYALRSYLYHKETGASYWSGLNIRNDKSVFSPRFMFNLIKLPPIATDEKGSKTTDAINLLANTGICTWSTSPYVEREYLVPVTSTQKQEALNFKIKNYGRVNETNLPKIKELIFQKKLPLVVSLPVDKTFQEPNKNIGNGYDYINVDGKKEICWKKTGPPTGLTHAMVVVGFNDDLHAFKLMNSYGRNWANAGFIWIDYDLFRNSAKNCYFIFDKSDGLEQVGIPTGKIDVAFKCEGFEPVNLTIDYYYKFTVRTTESYDHTKTALFLNIIRPDGKGFFRVWLTKKDPETSVETNDKKIFYGRFDRDNRPITASTALNKFYAYDISHLLTDLDNSKQTVDITGTSSEGVYKFQFGTRTNGTYVGTDAKFFSGSFFGYNPNTPCGPKAPSVGLYTVDI